jgi:hypothetical protein
MAYPFLLNSIFNASLTIGPKAKSMPSAKNISPLLTLNVAEVKGPSHRGVTPLLVGLSRDLTARKPV